MFRCFIISHYDYNVFLKIIVSFALTRPFNKWMKKTTPESPFTTFSKQLFGQNLSYEITFDLHENVPEGGSHFHLNAVSHGDSFQTQRQKAVGCDFLAISSLSLHLRSHVHDWLQLVTISYTTSRNKLKCGHIRPSDRPELRVCFSELFLSRLGSQTV